MASTWKADMAKFGRNLEKAAVSAHKRVGVEFLGNIIDATPLSLDHEDIFGRPRTPGRLKRSWWTAVGESAAFGGEHEPFGQMVGVLASSGVVPQITMTNFAPYALLIEFGIAGQPYVQAPPTWKGKYPAGINFQLTGGWVRETADKITQDTVDRVVK